MANTADWGRYSQPAGGAGERQGKGGMWSGRGAGRDGLAAGPQLVRGTRCCVLRDPVLRDPHWCDYAGAGCGTEPSGCWSTWVYRMVLYHTAGLRRRWVTQEATSAHVPGAATRPGPRGP